MFYHQSQFVLRDNQPEEFHYQESSGLGTEYPTGGEEPEDESCSNKVSPPRGHLLKGYSSLKAWVEGVKKELGHR
jgi:hypothetical protein